MKIDLQSQMDWGEKESLVDFFGAHSFAHETYSRKIRETFAKNTNVDDVADQAALTDWSRMIDLVKENKAAPVPPTLQAWLEGHSQLHASELRAMNVAVPTEFDLSSVDFRDRDQFHDWHDQHSRIHDFQDRVLGL